MITTFVKIKDGNVTFTHVWWLNLICQTYLDEFQDWYSYETRALWCASYIAIGRDCSFHPGQLLSHTAVFNGENNWRDPFQIVISWIDSNVMTKSGLGFWVEAPNPCTPVPVGLASPSNNFFSQLPLDFTAVVPTINNRNHNPPNSHTFNSNCNGQRSICLER